MFDIIQIPVLEDNYIYLLYNIKDKKMACIDPAVAEPVLELMEELEVELESIFLTHHHWDHTGGVSELKKASGCTVYCSKYDQNRLEDIDVALNEGDEVSFGEHKATVIDTPGHTLGHISYFFPKQQVLFCGDTLFANGCGRLFEGTAEQMWDSLQKLRALPEQTRVYCAHEYTLSNTEFALSITPDNKVLQKRMQDFQELRQDESPTVPVLLANEKMTNPFLNADHPNWAQAVGLEGQPSETVFKEIRTRKDHF